jgi:hypothetical protein
MEGGMAVCLWPITVPIFGPSADSQRGNKMRSICGERFGHIAHGFMAPMDSWRPWHRSDSRALRRLLLQNRRAGLVVGDVMKDDKTNRD